MVEKPVSFALGVDVVSVTDIAESIEKFGDSYLNRVFTAHELDSSSGTLEVRARALAARFAAKEATLKALRPDVSDAVPWTDIEICRHPSGWCEVVVRNKALQLAESQQVSDLTVSFSHDGDRATAVVVGWRGKVSHDRSNHS